MKRVQTDSSKNNLCGDKIRAFRLSQKEPYSQRMFAEEMQRRGINMDKWMISDIETGKRTVTDIEVKVIAEIIGISIDELLS